MTTIKANTDINVGVCPECSNLSSFTNTKKKNIYKCLICKKDVEQYINGRIIYKTINIPAIEVKE